MRTFAAAGVAAVSVALAAAPAAAQTGLSDAILAGRVHGQPIPAQLYDIAQRDPAAFEFRGVWKDRVRRLQERRARLTESGALSAALVDRDELAAAGAALDGSFRMPVLLGQFADVAGAYPAAAYQDRLFGPGVGSYSLARLYDEMSGGLFRFTGDVVGWVPLPRDAAAYLPDPADPDDAFGQTGLFLTETLDVVDPAVDFGLYDNDGPDGVPNSGDDDGFVDLAAFLYPLHGKECGGPGIWAHRWHYGGWANDNQYSTDDPAAIGGRIQVRDYILQGGIACDGAGLQEIGVMAHEAGHGFGLPDFYDTRTLDGSSGQGIGHWGLMGSGNWNTPASPAHMMAFSKNLLGWIDVAPLSADATGVLLPPVQSGRVAYRINVPQVPHEYFLLENRQPHGSDGFLAAPGLLVWHVDSLAYAAGLAGNTVNADASRKAVDLEEADGRNDLDLSANAGGNRGDATDPFDGSQDRRRFADDSAPGASSNSGDASGIVVEGIAQLADGGVRFDLMLAPTFAWGDVNGDGEVGGADVEVLLGFAVGAPGHDYALIARGDVDDDGDVDVRDAYIVDAFRAGRDAAPFRVGDVGVDLP